MTVRWRCFHCDETFTLGQKRWAREHFGADETKEPVCLIRSAGESALLTALRKAENELDRYREEDSDIMRSMAAMASDHGRALRDAEEAGYARGVRDARMEARGDGE